MAAGAQARGWDKLSRRRVPRYGVQAPLDVTMLRSGIPDTVPGRALNLCERGVAAVLASDMIPGEAVGVEVWLPLSPEPLRARALVRYQDQLRCGLEFVGLSAEQQKAIRTWAIVSKATAEPEPPATKTTTPNKSVKNDQGSSDDTVDASGNGSSGAGPGGPGKRGPGTKRRLAWVVVAVLGAILAAVFWWRWNRGWEELEKGLPSHVTSGDAPDVQPPKIQVPAEEMQKLLVHRVDPEYPASARQEKLQAVILLAVVVGRDGSVLEAHALNGPAVLARAALDAVRWWKFQPYALQGKPVMVETTVAVEFKL